MVILEKPACPDTDHFSDPIPFALQVLERVSCPQETNNLIGRDTPIYIACFHVKATVHMLSWVLEDMVLL